MTNERVVLSSGTVWENVVGYSRLVKVGNTIEVSGTTAVEDDRVVGEGDMYAQAHFILTKIQNYLHQAGATMAMVVRTRMYVTDIKHWQHAAKAHGEFFSEIKPATTMVEVRALIDPKLLIEIEVTAIV